MSPPRIKIEAPVAIDLYRPKNHVALTRFLTSLRHKVGILRKPVLITFNHTKRITAAGGLLFLSEIDRLITEFGAHMINATKPPPQRDPYYQTLHTVEAVLNQIGFYKTIGSRERKVPKAQNVECWSVESGNTAHGNVAGEMLQKVKERISMVTSKTLYRGSIEAVANCVEHAYRGRRDDGLNLDDRRWWMFVGILSGKLTVLVSDLGVGIPNTITKTQPPTLIQRIFSLFGFKAVNDSGWIKTATLVKATRTAESNRGKGGGDLRSLLEREDSAALTIFSNYGSYKFSQKILSSGKRVTPETLYDNKYSILGTIVEWTIEADQTYD